MIFRRATETRIRHDKKNTREKERGLKRLWNEAFFHGPVDYEMNKKNLINSSLFQLLSREERPREQYYFSAIMSKGWTIIFVKERLPTAKTEGHPNF